MNLFKAIFGAQAPAGRFPETLIDAATERAVDGTDPRLRLLPGYKRRLREPVIGAIEHACALVQALPGPVPAGQAGYGAEPVLAALFASPQSMLEAFSRAPDLIAFLDTPVGRGASRITAMLGADRAERNVLGLDLVGDQVRREVAQVSVSFGGHRLVEPAADLDETRRQLRHRAFDHLLLLALGRINDAVTTRADLLRERDLLRRRQQTLERGGCSLHLAGDPTATAEGIRAELDAISAQLAELGGDSGVLAAHLDLVVGTLTSAPELLRFEPLLLHLDAMNIQRDPADPAARALALAELHSASGARRVVLLVSIDPGELPPREDFLDAASRYQY